MRLSILILMLPAAVAASAPSPPKAGTPDRCPPDRILFAERDVQGQAQPKKLGEEPPGKLYLTVDRKVNGCRQPVIVRYGIGAAEAPAPARRD